MAALVIPVFLIGVLFNTLQGFMIARRQWMAGFRFSPTAVLLTVLLVWALFAYCVYLVNYK